MLIYLDACVDVGGEMDSKGDFSEVKKEGTYKIVTGNGEELTAEVAGDYAHEMWFMGNAKSVRET